MDPLALPGDWENALDVEDSDLSSLLRPCKRLRLVSSSPPLPSQSLYHPLPHCTSSSSSSSSSTLIPGPAGAVQAAMLRKARNKNSASDYDEPPIPTQEFIRRAIEDAADDDDFKRKPWLSALQFLAQQETERGDIHSTPICSVNESINIDRVDQVVAVIKSMTPNGLGDLMVTLKDPTGTIRGSIHHKVLAEAEFAKEISIGCVLILEKIAVFAPSRSARYLNITSGNVVKVISRECGALPKENYPVAAIKFKHVGVGSECTRKDDNVEKPLSGEMDRSEGIKLKDDNCGQSADDERAHTSNENSEKMEGMWMRRQVLWEEIKKRRIRREESIIGHDEQSQRGGQSSPSTSNIQHKYSPATNNEEILEVGKQRDHQIIMSSPSTSKASASLPSWTDEQLNELFAADCDDDDGF
ncbi:hypothetical protein NMG60_11024140 [Bertholletia excelsa]